MPTKAKLFIGITIAAGTLFLVGCFGRPNNFADLPIYISCFALALLSSALKVRLPGITGNISTNFLFVLIAITMFSLTETVVLASAACLVQCLWKTKRRPKTVQVLFNVSVLVLSSGVSYQISHRLAGKSNANLPVLLALAACLYFTINSFLISGVLSIVDNKLLMQVWHQCYLWSFPYYLAGAAVAGLLVVSSRNVGWATSLLILPIMYLVYVFYSMCVERLGESPASPRTA
jgi:hypothetical protein